MYFSVGLSLIYGALDQGERLYWLHSGVIVGMLSAGTILILASLVRRLVQPLPVLDLKFLSTKKHHCHRIIDLCFQVRSAGDSGSGAQLS